MVTLSDKLYKDILMSHARKEHIIRSATIEITDLCNYKCAHCYIHGTYSALMSKENFCWIVDELKSQGCIWLLLTGGEILCHPDFLDMYKYAYKKGFIITLFTNGYNLSEKIINTLLECPPYSIEITLYGGTQEHYDNYVKVQDAFSTVDKNIHKLYEKKLPITLKTVLTKELYKGYQEIVQYATQLSLPLRIDGNILPKVSGERVDSLRLTPLEVVEEDIKRYPELLLNGRKSLDNYIHTSDLYSCAAGKNSIFVDARMRACMCSMARHIFSPIGPAVRSIKEAQKDIIDLISKKEKLNKGNNCYTCKYRPLCRYCPGQFLLENGSEYIPIDWYCRYAEIMYNKITSCCAESH